MVENENVFVVLKCKDCGVDFKMLSLAKLWYDSHNVEVPEYCDKCLTKLLESTKNEKI